MSENTKQDLDSIEALFVQSAHGVTTSNGSVTFHGTGAPDPVLC